ncbi:hypothetical protein SAMN05444128_2724 [Pontibacter indicus]|uniref:Uncharacterized protein n=1 Tax=Pontibacter indicus TaxID=1317125 RepID=A0A1R3XKB0_9BACT|nr:hypothetical protein SAMN05444128_2724 [Pontibacter indicus]
MCFKIWLYLYLKAEVFINKKAGASASTEAPAFPFREFTDSLLSAGHRNDYRASYSISMYTT